MWIVACKCRISFLTHLSFISRLYLCVTVHLNQVLWYLQYFIWIATGKSDSCCYFISSPFLALLYTFFSIRIILCLDALKSSMHVSKMDTFRLRLLQFSFKYWFLFVYIIFLKLVYCHVPINNSWVCSLII